jgi:hypothetical protein
MDQTISAIDTITLRVPLDIWAPAPRGSAGPGLGADPEDELIEQFRV